MPFLTTHVGSMPHDLPSAVCETLAEMLDVPAWPQLPQRTFLENMYVQYSAGLPGIVLDPEHERVHFNTNGDLSGPLEQFYARVLSDDLDSFALDARFAAGFFTMLETLGRHPGNRAKGQVTGPVSFGLTVTDQDLRAALYHPDLADVIVKNAAMNARWQVRQLRAHHPDVIVFVDEPYMASFGSAYISLGREQVVTMLNEVFTAIQQEGSLAGVHCCANTDWSVLLETRVDILNLDAYGYVDNLALYPAELKAFLGRGGMFAWGIVPNNDQVFSETAASLAARLLAGMQGICDKAARRGVEITLTELADHSLISPSCGLGSASVEAADAAIAMLKPVSEALREVVI